MHTFTNPTPAAFDSFGTSVSVDGDRVLVGAYADDTGAPDAGAAYLFEPTFTLDLILNKEPPVYQKGERMIVKAHLVNIGPTQTVRYLQQLFLPDGSEFLNARIDKTVELFSGDSVFATFGRRLPAIPAGEYRWRAQLLDPETSEVLATDEASWEFVGEGGSPANLAQLVGGLDVSAAPARPVATQLLASYPNPFNPETWIPYQLAERAHVRIVISDVTGKLVRTLELGERAPGSYLNPSQAAHWDGRNDAGEPVASGVYFVQFHAGDFRASRKMILEK
ncbi:T9SS type A sorting domain-containing protein [Candidatus Poribacteria bacterium]|nr:T9SS type A sorting domain-containing protein [Candidatus Poribacteria bacterium]